ncbi:glycosyltransferase family 2 protein [Algibacter sp. PT7-4]|uniref:glycosyltransferase family 2 protein n=1 Tax=Algibacter ulvanivorans TaxID=3400999 RepID=UPI003AAC3D24
MKPLVSICIPTYNGAKFITEAMESAIKQSYSNLEIIVSDDNSKDETLKIIEDYKSKTNIPIAIYNHKPNGIGANWNNCIKNAKGDYIKFLFQDDTIVPSCIDKMVEQAIKNPRIGLVYSKRNFIYEKNEKNKNWIKTYGNLHTSWSNLKIENNKAYSGKVLLANKKLLEVPINKIGEPTAVLLKKDVFNKVGYFSTILKQSLDIEFWYRLMKYYSVVFINEELVTFRLHEDQASAINKNNYLSEVKLFNKHLYSNLFWQLHLKNKRMLFYECNILGLLIKKIINKLAKNN